MKVMNTRCKIFLLLSLLLFNCCELFEPHEYAGKIRGEKSINTTNLYQIENNCRNKEVIKFAVISDSQGWYNQLEDCVNDIFYTIKTTCQLLYLTEKYFVKAFESYI